jgi:hypothetical protein
MCNILSIGRAGLFVMPCCSPLLSMKSFFWGQNLASLLPHGILAFAKRKKTLSWMCSQIWLSPQKLKKETPPGSHIQIN